MVTTAIVLASTRVKAAPAVIDDARVERAVVRARTKFLATQSFDRFDVTVLVRRSAEQRGSEARVAPSAAVVATAAQPVTSHWRRGSVGGSQLAYPASCVKLGYLVAAVHWCAAQRRAPECLDADVRPMIVESDNEATGRVVDAISGTPNAADPTADFDAWLEKRRFTERVLSDWGVLQGQRLLTKTYPTNSGEVPSGFEARALEVHGRNAMSPDGAAQLMLGIVSARIEPQASEYMRALLRRPRFTTQGSLGAGLPPGSIVENKIGTAFDTLEDIAWIRLPNGHELIIAAFSNGWDQREGAPWDALRFGGFTEALIRELGLTKGLPARRVFGNAKASDTPNGSPSARWRITAPRAARYELAVWYEAAPHNTPQARYRVGTSEVIARGTATIDAQFDQRIWGSRWLPIGELELKRGERVEVLVEAVSPGRLANARLAFTEVPVRATGGADLHSSTKRPNIELDLGPNPSDLAVR